MGTWFEDVIIFIFSYGWFFGMLPLIIGIIGAVYFSYYPNMSYWKWKRKLENEKVNHGADVFHGVLYVQHGDGWVTQKNVYDLATEEEW